MWLEQRREKPAMGSSWGNFLAETRTRASRNWEKFSLRSVLFLAEVKIRLGRGATGWDWEGWGGGELEGGEGEWSVVKSVRRVTANSSSSNFPPPPFPTPVSTHSISLVVIP